MIHAAEDLADDGLAPPKDETVSMESDIRVTKEVNVENRSMNGNRRKSSTETNTYE